MEGQREWAFCAFGGATPAALAAPSLAASYLPAGWKKRSRKLKTQTEAKRRKAATAAAAAAVAVAAAADVPYYASVPSSPPPNPAQLAPLRCSWPHPAVLELVAQQSWPAAGPAALARRVPGSGCPPSQPATWWNRMLPSLSLLHPPLSAQQQLGLAAAASSGGSDAQDDSALGAVLRSAQLSSPYVLVGYEDDWLEVPAAVLPLWQATPLAPFAGPKALLHYLVAPQSQLAAAAQLVKDVESLFDTCNLGTHVPASSQAVHAFHLTPPGSASAGSSSAAGVAAGAAGQQDVLGQQQQQQGQKQQQQQQEQQKQQEEKQQRELTARYLAGLRAACEQLQRLLLLDPPPQLQQLQSSSLEEGAEPAVLVYVACPLDEPAGQVAALLEAASCLAPCTQLGAAADAGATLSLLQHAPSGIELAGSMQPHATLAPAEPQQPDRPATATPATDTSRAPGGSPPPDEIAELDAVPGGTAGANQQAHKAQQGAQQGREQGKRYRGAAQGLHDQLRGDFRHLPVRRLCRPEGSRPVKIVIQLLCPQALADISGTAARCTAFALYSKVQHVPSTDGLDLAGAGCEGAAPPASLPFCSQPLMVLASALRVELPAGQQQQQQQEVEREEEQQQGQLQQQGGQPQLPPEQGQQLLPENGQCTEQKLAAQQVGQQQPQQPAAQHSGQQQQQQLAAQQDGQQQQQEQQRVEACSGPGVASQRRTLHCFYALPPPGCSLLPLALADSCGELVHAELLDTSAGSSLGMAGSSSADSLVAALADVGAVSGSNSNNSAVFRTCRLVLRRCLEVLIALRAACCPPGLLHNVAIAGSGMQAAERKAWRQLVEGDAGLPLELPAGAELAVLELRAPPPARYAGADPPSGCQLVLQRSIDGTGELQASVTWLPPADAASSLLPREHDVVRTLLATLVCRCLATCQEMDSEQQQQQQERRGEVDSLCQLAGELHGLAWLHAAFQGACLRTVAGGGQEATTDAHLPLHAAMAGQLRALLAEACACQTLQ